MFSSFFPGEIKLHHALANFVQRHRVLVQFHCPVNSQIGIVQIEVVKTNTPPSFVRVANVNNRIFQTTNRSYNWDGARRRGLV